MIHLRLLSVGSRSSLILLLLNLLLPLLAFSLTLRLHLLALLIDLPLRLRLTLLLLLLHLLALRALLLLGSGGSPLELLLALRFELFFYLICLSLLTSRSLLALKLSQFLARLALLNRLLRCSLLLIYRHFLHGTFFFALLTFERTQFRLRRLVALLHTLRKFSHLLLTLLIDGRHGSMSHCFRQSIRAARGHYLPAVINLQLVLSLLLRHSLNLKCLCRITSSRRNRRRDARHYRRVESFLSILARPLDSAIRELASSRYFTQVVNRKRVGHAARLCDQLSIRGNDHPPVNPAPEILHRDDCHGSRIIQVHIVVLDVYNLGHNFTRCEILRLKIRVIVSRQISFAGT